MIRVVLADDEALVRAGVRAVLASDEEIDVVAEAADGREAIAVVQAKRPSVALLDIRMPVLDGLAAAREIRRTMPDVRLVILTTFGEADYIAAAFDIGVDAFVLKGGDPREMFLAIHAVLDGGAFLSPPVARRLVSGEVARAPGSAAAAKARISTLTERERSVLVLLARGRSNAEIGAELHLVEGTVKGHVTAILRALRVRNRVESALVAYRAGLLD